MRIERIALSLLVLSGCLGTEIGNPQEGEVVLRVTSPDDDMSRVGALRMAGLEIDSVAMSLVDVRFKGEFEEAGDPNANGVAELVRGGERAVFDIGLDVPGGEYREVHMKASGFSGAAGESPQMEGLSLRMAGRRADGVPFVLEDDRTLNIKVTGDVEPLRVGAGGPDVLFLVVDVASWFEEGELDVLEPGEDGWVRIGRGQNLQVGNRVRQRVRSSMRFGQDRDDDGRPSAVELGGFSVEVR